MIHRFITIALTGALVCLCAFSGGSAGAQNQSRDDAAAQAGGGLKPFASEAEFERLLEAWAEQAATLARADAELRRVVPTSPPSPPAAAADASAADAPAADESITNVQTEGVDEGGIVKRHGDHLVVLRRGRLFTVRIGDDRLQPVSTVDAFGPGTDPGGAWYDEMLIGADTVVVVGYSYARGGTELVLFDISRDGALSYRDTWHLRSNDYYSSRNYASRLIGQTLVFYSPMVISRWNLAERDFIPGLRRWRPAEVPADFRRILPATRIYRSDEDINPIDGVIALHTVTRCDLSRAELDCTSTAVLGPQGRVFYVSADSVFIWTTGRGGDQANTSSVFRIPLDERVPTGLKARGVPVDQLSFLHGPDDYLNVLLAQSGLGEGMWGDETGAGALALLRVPLDSFGDGHEAAPASAYRLLPGRADGAMQNRYIGDWLLYGSAPYRWAHRGDAGATSQVHALRFAANDVVQTLALPHGAERVEAIGGHAIVVGSTGDDLHFTSVRLDDQRAATGTSFVRADAAQGESRTHGFFYRGESASQGIVGLPVIGQRRGNDMQRYLRESAAVMYLRNHDLELRPMGELAADADAAIDDNCKASCVDWYGNARPIFIGERVFALLGYELVEGRITDERIVERRRASFAPTRPARGR